MLNKQVITQGDALEVHLCKPLDKLQFRDMTELETEVFVGLYNSPEEEWSKQDELNSFWQYKALVKRADVCVTDNFDKRVLFMILIISDQAIGTAIMYLYYCQYLAKKKNIHHVDMEAFSNKMFPSGFFNSASLHDIWGACKVEVGDRTVNLINFSGASLSLQFEYELKMN